MVIAHDPAPAPADPFSGLHLSAPDVTAEDLDDALLSPFVSYQSDTFGYKLRFPSTWSLDDSKTDFHGDIFTDPREQVVVTISETDGVYTVTPEGITRVAKSIEESLQYDPAFKLTTFERLYWKEQPTIFTEGTRTIGGKRYHTREYNIVRPAHSGILNISITTQEDSETLHEKAVQEILKSLDVCPKKS